MNDPNATTEFLDRLQRAIDDGTLVKLTLGHYHGIEPGLQKVLVRPVQIRGQRQLSCVFRYPTRDVTRNLSPAAALREFAASLGADFQSAYLATTQATVEFTCRPGKRPRLMLGKPRHEHPPDLRHDRRKSRHLAPQTDPWLHALGVTTAAGAVCAGMEAKFRQIHHFLEILAPLLGPPAGGAPADVHLVDMGCGKGYLTFAACSHLQRAGWNVSARGIEARPELVEHGNQVARQHNFAGLQFETGSIATVALDHVDVLVALHACDTATDDAIAKGIHAGASLILVAPCCQHELRPQLQPPPALAEPCRHGILRQRQAEWITDALRAALLEWAGYETRVFEFVATEHTPKNLMIAAVKRSRPNPEELRAARVRDLAALFGIRHQRLADQLQFPLAPAEPARPPHAP